MFSSIVSNINNDNIEYLTKSNAWLEAQLTMTAKIIDEHVENYKHLKSAYDIKKQLQQQNMLIVNNGINTEVVKLSEAVKNHPNLPELASEGYDIFTAINNNQP